MTDNIKTTIADGVLRISIDRAQKKNALTIPMYAAMADAIYGASENNEVRAVMLEGVPDIFTAGNDLADFMSGAAFDHEKPPVLEFIRSVIGCTKPLIAAVSGGAIGIGTTILFHFDLVYADESAYFHMPFADLGLVPEAGASYILPRRYGQQIAAEFLILAKKVSPQRAYDIGLVNEVVHDEDVREFAFARAKEVAAKPPIAMGFTKQLLKETDTDLIRHMEAEAVQFKERAQSDEMRGVVMQMMMKASAK